MEKIKKLIQAAKTLSLAQAEKCPWWINFSEGNKKLKPTAKVKYLIFNLPAIITCPGATRNCIKYCYARKAERYYPTVLPSRQRNLERTKKDSFASDVILTIEAHLRRLSYQTAETIVIRIHESGDFYNREYTKAWLKIARHFVNNPKVVFMAYTKSIDFFQGLKIPNNMTIRFSLWNDTKPDQAKKAFDMGLPIYTAIDKFTIEKGINRCGCVNCSACRKCWNKEIDWLYCEIH